MINNSGITSISRRSVFFRLDFYFNKITLMGNNEEAVLVQDKVIHGKDDIESVWVIVSKPLAMPCTVLRHAGIHVKQFIASTHSIH